MIMRIFVVFVIVCGVLNLKVICDSSAGNASLEDSHVEIEEEKNNLENSEIFKPTHEWQKVKEGQAIPKGLHVRINLETGEKEAKLLDDGERTDLTSVSLDEEPVVEEPESQELNLEELQAALKNLKGEEISEDAEKVKKKFRSYETLKKDFEDLELAVLTDSELLTELLARFKAGGDDHEVLNVLTDLEYLVHQFDNARDFARMGGLTDVVLPSLNASSPLIRSEAIRLLGSATQSNTAVQIAALESGSISALLRVLALDKDPAVRSRTVFALSCLVRQFPTALMKMVTDGGLDVFATLFQSESQDDLKLQVKVVTLLHDLVLEVKETERALEGDPNAELKEKHRQYGLVGLTRRLVDDGWCARLPRLLHASPSSKQRTDRRNDLSSAVTRELPVRPEHDVVEKVVAAMLALADVCVDRFRDAKDILISLEQWYKELAAREELDKKTHNVSDEPYYYYTGLAQQVASLTALLELHRDEL